MIALRSLISLLLLGIGTAVFSHQEKAAVTEILINERSGHLEVAHRFYLHDAEHAVKLMGGNGADIFKSRETQKVFYDHVVRNFALYIDEQPLKLKNIGFEIEDLFFWAYQEMPLDENLLLAEAIHVHHSSLQHFWPDQINTVNFEPTRGKVKTAIFETNSDLIRLAF